MSAPLLGPLTWNLVFVDDHEKMRDFYANVLGLTVKHVSSSATAFSTGGCTLELMARMDNGPSDEPGVEPARGWDRNRVLMSFKVENMKDVVDELVRRGAKLTHGPADTVPPDGEPPSGQVAQFEDPEGNLIEICDEPVFH